MSVYKYLMRRKMSVSSVLESPAYVDIPEECLEHIFSFLDFDSIKNVCLVSKYVTTAIF